MAAMVSGRKHRGQGLRGGVGRVGQEDEKSGAGTELAMHLDAAPGVFNHVLDHVQTDATAFDVVVKALEHGEQARQVLRRDAEAVVVHF